MRVFYGSYLWSDKSGLVSGVTSLHSDPVRFMSKGLDEARGGILQGSLGRAINRPTVARGVGRREFGLRAKNKMRVAFFSSVLFFFFDESPRKIRSWLVLVTSPGGSRDYPPD